MQLFYTKNIKDNIASLPIEEARHAMQVLRKRLGDEIDLVDGMGSFYKGQIIEANKKQCLVKVLESRFVERTRPLLSIAIAPTKNIDRMEWFVEKATEIGVDEIIPLLCERSERKRVRTDRLEKITLAAMKQSLKAYLPEIRTLTSLNDFLEENYEDYDRFIAYCNDDQLPHLKELATPNRNTLILIGPEGDFSETEVTLAKSKSFKGISLGQSRLRTETAGIVACTIMNLIQKG
jgi:16S rRNA (uracil1498-N3)-methyltransferase